MKIGIDASKFSVLQKTGTEYYTEEIIKRLISDSHNNYILYSQKPLSLNLPSHCSNIVIPFPYLWTQVGLSLKMLTQPPDVLFIPAHVIPIIHPKNTVYTCHDLAFRRYPAFYSSFQRLYLESSVRQAVIRASRIIAVSESTKKDLITFYGCSPEKIVVIYHGYNKQIYHTDIKAKRKIKSPYILFVGRIEERKNIRGLVTAFAFLKKKSHPSLKLVLAGKPGYGYPLIKQFIDERPSNVRRDIMELGYVDEKQLTSLYCHASAFIFPSFYEGFGFPVVEAMASGCPVVCSDIAPLREIGGDAALFFNPRDPEEMAQKLDRIIADKNLGRKMVAKGLKNVERFSWEQCAKQTNEILEGKR